MPCLKVVLVSKEGKNLLHSEVEAISEILNKEEVPEFPLGKEVDFGVV